MTTTSDPSSDDLVEGLKQTGFRAGRDALAAFFTHAHKSRLGPTQTVEELLALERRAREATNLARRTRAAYLGKFKPPKTLPAPGPPDLGRARLISLR
jgi:hypothetical protein